MKRENGCQYFYQWEQNQRLIVQAGYTEVHFDNGTQENALPCKVFEENGLRLVNVPNILMQTAAELHCYAWDEEKTSVVAVAAFTVVPRRKPADYAYEQTEIISVRTEVQEFIKKAIEKGELTGPQGPQGEKGDKGDRGEKGDKGDPCDIRIDDTAVSANAWSSKNIVDKLCPAFKKIGTVVQCEPVEGYTLGIVAQIECTQEGDGDPSPDNVRTIMGHDGVVLMHCGKNLFDKDSFKLTAGRYVRSAGDLTQYSSSSNYACTEGFIPVTHLRGKIITLNHPPKENNGENPKMVFYTAADGTTAISGTSTSGYTTEVPNNANYMRFSTPKAYADGTQIQIEIGSTVTDYEPYKADEPISVAFGETIYKGDFDFATGLLKVTHKCVAMGGLDWYFDPEDWTFCATLDNCKVNADNQIMWDLLCNVYAPAIDGLPDDKRIFVDYQKNGTETRSIVNVWDYDFDEDDVDMFISRLTDRGAMLVYPLEVPEIVQLDAQQVVAMQGLNTVYGNTGSVEVKGKKDPVALVNSLLYRIEKLEAAAVNNT